MNLKYTPALTEESIIKDIIQKLSLNHINSNQVRCVFSEKSTSKRIIARLHPTQKIISFAFGTKPLYIIELISENFKKLNEKDKIKTLIHELMHIPETFSGAPRHHKGLGKRGFNGRMGKTLNCKTIDAYYNQYINT